MKTGAGDCVWCVSAPQLLEPGGVARGLFDGALNVAMSEIILNEPRVIALVGERKAAGVAEHVRMGQEGQGGGLAVCLQSQIDRGRVQRLPLLADKEVSCGPASSGRFVSATRRWPGVHRRARAAWSIGRPSSERYAAGGLECPPGRASAGRLRKPAGRGGTSEATATVAGLVAAALGRGQQPFHLDSGQVFALAIPVATLGRRVSPAAPVAAPGASIAPPGSAPCVPGFPAVHHFVESSRC